MRTIAIMSAATFLIVVAAIVTRTRFNAHAIKHDAPRRLSLHAVPPADYTRLNSKFSRQVPENLKTTLLPDDRPAVLIFLKADCKCSNNFARLFNALEPHLRQAAYCLAVIEGTDQQARAFVAKNGFTAPFLAQHNSNLAAAWGIGKAGAVALVRPNRETEVIWPGMSRQVFRDLTNRLGNQNMVPEEILNTLPGASTAGCPLYPISVSNSQGVD
jgi:peroxiredoxin